MTQLFFEYGTTDSGKTIEILKVVHNYGKQNKPVILMTSGLDTRDGVGRVSSCIGLCRDAIPIFEETNVSDLINDLSYKPFCVLVDEYQFLNKYHVIEFARIIDELNIPVMAFGLENDFRNELFKGLKYLLLYADKLEELKAICWFCHKRTTMNLYYIDSKPVYERDRIQIGEDGAHYSVCRKRYSHPKTMDEGQ